MRQRDSELNSYWGTICTPLRLKAFDGKMRKTNCASTELGEAATTEITRVDDAKGFQESKHAAHKGGEVAGKARKDLERKTRKGNLRGNLRGQLTGRWATYGTFSTFKLGQLTGATYGTFSTFKLGTCGTSVKKQITIF
jgi:hypothetical protein